MNRFSFHISWIDALVVPETLTSIQNALKFSTVPTEIHLILNEQTILDVPIEGEPKDMWKHFMDHPLIPQCRITYVTNSDPFMQCCTSRRDDINPDGLTYWGESDCLLPLEYFYVAEAFHKAYKHRPYVMTFAQRKMWPSWEIIEHPSVQTLPSLDDIPPEYEFMRCDKYITLEKLYQFNKSQGDAKIGQLSISRLEGALTILSDGMPYPIISPDLEMGHEDFCLELAMRYYNIPQFHVLNIIKGHNMHHPNKRTNLVDKKQHSPIAQQMKDETKRRMTVFIQDLYSGKYNRS